jgi:hypothetical protein
MRNEKYLCMKKNDDRDAEQFKDGNVQMLDNEE